MQSSMILDMAEPLHAQEIEQFLKFVSMRSCARITGRLQQDVFFDTSREASSGNAEAAGEMIRDGTHLHYAFLENGTPYAFDAVKFSATSDQEPYITPAGERLVRDVETAMREYFRSGA